MKARYWSASARIEILARSTFCWRASASRRSSGPSKPSTSTTSAGSSVARSAGSGRLRSDGSSGRHDAPSARLRPHPPRSPSARRARARVELDGARAAGRARRRRAARPRRPARHGGRHRLHLLEPPLQCSTTSQPAAIAARVRSRSSPTALPWRCRRSSTAPRNPIESRESLPGP